MHHCAESDRAERAAAELDVLVRFSLAAEGDRILDRVAKRDRQAGAERPCEPETRHPVEADARIADAAQRLGAVMDVAVGRRERRAVERLVA
jgi:hypothetical protein